MKVEKGLEEILGGGFVEEIICLYGFVKWFGMLK